MNPPRLNQRKNSTLNIRLFILNHPYAILIIALVIVFLLFTVLIYSLTGLSTVDSGAYYNHMHDVV